MRMSFYHELKRRNVFRVGAAYIFAAWLLIQVAETIFPLFGYGDTPARITVILLAIGFPLFLVFSWVFELTPEGLKKEKDVDHTASVVRKTGKQLDRIIIVLLALALGYFAFDKFVLDPAQDLKIAETARQEGRSEALVESYGDKSIAVLPFVNLSADPEQEYFSDGISEELLNLLARIPELRVISRSSAFYYKGKDIDIPTIAQQLNVTHILEGSVRKAGNRVRITAQLVEARSDTHIWSDIFDRTLDDIFTTQNEIASDVVMQLKVKLLEESAAVQQTNPVAYTLYLQASHVRRQGTAESTGKAIELLNQALAIEPTYARAWTGLASAYSFLATSGLRPKDEAFQLAREAATQALAIDPDYAMAHTNLGWIALNYDDLVAAAEHLQRALAVEPTDQNILSYAASLIRALGRLDEAIALEEHLLARDPVNSYHTFNLGYSYLLAGRWDETIVAFRTVLTLSPNFRSAHYWIGVALLLKGESVAALAAFEQEVDEEYRVMGTALALHAMGRQTEYEAALAELIERWGEQWPQDVAQVFAWTGDADSAFAWLDKAVAQNKYEGDFQFPLYTPLHADPRWLAFRERTGQSEVRLAAIVFRVTVPE